MANLSTKIKLYCETNGKTANFNPIGNVSLQNDSDGNLHIKEWNIEGLAQPTDEQLNALEIQATKLENNNKIDATRRTSYGSWNKQLDEIYHNIDDWKARIKAVKDSNPKESS